ncbi:ARM repeat-containing protein [Amniculicola lignicola CBS 123094]|uniref:ARM repeat-containing protein n=1 Tax=Amniculicola lignicola CBS 123094 TaxID=1392246 RepID=A0A6A5WMT2_9PLEO|nr:ARM repeat-containing protein [Amniculicola lignicola CBS 123094]
MAGLKRKTAVATQSDDKKHSKKVKIEKGSSKSATKRSSKDSKSAATPRTRFEHDEDDIVESDTTEDENGAYGFSANKSAQVDSAEEDNNEDDADAMEDVQYNGGAKSKKDHKEKFGKYGENKSSDPSKSAGLNATSSKEAHAKQKALAKERKAAKPNADIIEQSKKLWEKLRLKSHIEKGERQKLVAELFEVVTGRVKDFVFKHDSVRVVQTALKYSTMPQRRMIAHELSGEFKTLAEGRYSKFLIAKLLEKGDAEIQNLIIPEFYGHVKRLINHPEAAWILDDTYRAVASPKQKKRLLREWYGPEFSIKGLSVEGSDTADLAVILKETPEKRKPIMDYLQGQINQMIQKKLTGFTMLHDAMLQYFLVCKPGSAEANEFLEHLKPDATLKEGEEADNVDLLKNLAFTPSGSRIVSLAFAYGTAKDRKLLLRPYKDTIEMMAFDANAHHVLLSALAVVDDTKLTSKSIFGDLLPSNDTLAEKVLALSNNVHARVVLLYPFAPSASWLVDQKTKTRLSELYAIREATSKKDANTRLQEIARVIEPQLLTAIRSHIADFSTSSFGLQCLGEVLIGAPEVEPTARQEALLEVAALSQQILEPPAEPSEIAPDAGGKQDVSAHGKNLLKTLVAGGKYDPKTKKVTPVEPALGFAGMFWDQIKDSVIEWATGQGSFVILSLVEAEGFERKKEVLKALKKGRKELEAAAGPLSNGEKKQEKGEKKAKREGNAGARLLLEQL